MPYPLVEPYDAGHLDVGDGHVDRIAHLPAVLVRGRLDIASPLSPAWDLARRWPAAELHVVESDAHGDGDTTNDLLVAATDRLAHQLEPRSCA